YQTVLPTDLSLWIAPTNCRVFRRALPLDFKSFDEICHSLDSRRPVILALRISESFYTPDADGIVEQKNPDPETGHHALVAVGHGKTSKRQFVLVRNSWGPTWGVEGYAFVEKGYLEKRLILTSAIN